MNMDAHEASPASAPQLPFSFWTFGGQNTSASRRQTIDNPGESSSRLGLQNVGPMGDVAQGGRNNEGNLLRQPSSESWHDMFRNTPPGDFLMSESNEINEGVSQRYTELVDRLMLSDDEARERRRST